MSKHLDTTTATPGECLTDTAVLLFEIGELERWRDGANLPVLPPVDCVCGAPRDSRVIRSLLDHYSAYPALRNDAAALIACEIETRRLMLAALGKAV